MSKYNNQQLQVMARVIMFNPNSEKSKQLVWAIVLKTGMLPNDVMDKIEKLAVYGVYK